MSEKRTRRVLIPEKKKEIVEFKEKNPTFGQQKIADHFTQVWGYPVARRTVGDILKEKEKWKAADKSTNTIKRTAKHEALEEALML